MMYRFHCCDVYGKAPVWLVYISSNRSYICTKKSLVVLVGLNGDVLSSLSVCVFLSSTILSRAC